MHKVKCIICGQPFDRDKVQAVRVGARRYAHQACDPDNTDLEPLAIKEDPELTKLKDYIKQIYGDSCNWAMTNKYINKFVNENGYSYSGILKSLVYFFEVKGNSIEKANGSIGIVPYVYQNAYDYYYSLFLAKQQNQDKNVISMTQKTKEITIKPPKIKKKIKFFNFEEGESIDGK